MRHTTAEKITIVGKFDTGDTVTIALYDLSDDSTVTLTSSSCAEIGTTGIFKWNSSSITTQPTSFVEYLWVMDNGVTKQYGKIVLGGYPDEVSEIHKLHGLKLGKPMTVTQTERTVDDITLSLDGDGQSSVTVTRQ